ncbi:MAG: DUF4147 domain-containing protein [Candidatus Lokiarchaeota archaeon]|nr:DUF4147 domain-containing protein [Candidatus Lokiarchaeota archaeon]
MTLINNRESLIKSAINDKNKRGREYILNIFQKAVMSVLPRNLIKGKLFIKDGILNICDYKKELKDISNIFLIGGGKATGGMAKAVLKRIPKRIQTGVINIPERIVKKIGDLKNIEIIGAGHPIPTKKGFDGTKKMLYLIEKAEKDDLIICLISGGGSALMPYPFEGISLKDLQELTDLFLKAGLSIEEINIIRKHCSRIKGGQLVRNNKADFVSLIISDVLNDPLDMIASGPTVPDKSTFEDVKQIIEKYELREAIPTSIKNHLEQGYQGNIPDTPKKGDPIFKKVRNFIIGNLDLAVESGIKLAEEYEIHVKKISTSITGEASEVGLKLLSKLKSANKPIMLIGGGETTVTVKGNGKGGRNQEIVLSACRKINELGIIIASLGTDGIDGNSDAAGAIADYSVIKKIEEKGLSINEFLKENDSYSLFKKINDGAIFTGYTGTNVNDIHVLLSI